MKYPLTGVVLALISPMFIAVDPVSPSCKIFTPKCGCGLGDYYGSKQFIVNCTNANITDTSILEHLPSETQVLIFSGNNIRVLPWNVFGKNETHSALRVVDMSNNGIVEILGKAYHRVGSVERLILNHNDISIASSDSNNHHHARMFSNFNSLVELHLTNAFADNATDNLAEDLHDVFIYSELNHLNKLHLEQNEITGFNDQQVFCSLPQLMDLHLGDNLLPGIHFNISCLEHLRFLDLERNQIMALDNKDFDVLDTFPLRKKSLTVDLRGNPFKCGHEMEQLCTWFQHSKVDVREKNSITCTNKNSINTDRVIMPKEVDCVPKQTLSAVQAELPSSPALLTFVLTALTVVLLSLVCLLLYVNRDQISYQLRPVMDSITRKVQYTSIGKQEEHEMVL